MKPVKHCRKLIDKVLSCIDTISNLSNVTLTNFVKSVELQQNSMPMH